MQASMTWQQRVEKLRAERGWSIAELSRRANINKDALYKQLKSVSKPRGDVVRRVAAALGTGEQWLRTGKAEQAIMEQLPRRSVFCPGQNYSFTFFTQANEKVAELEGKVVDVDPPLVVVQDEHGVETIINTTSAAFVSARLEH